jgi:Zn finger protein HypA/HybF involved in hydrogenase expression
MHDYQAVETIVRRLTEAGLRDVAEVRIQAGPAFSPVALLQAYEMVTLGTPLATSRLKVETADEECVCPSCGQAWNVRCGDVAGHVVVCPACDTPTSIDGLASVRIVGID